MAVRAEPFIRLDRFSAPTRIERVIAAGRAILVAASLVAIWLDPSEPAHFAGLAYATLVVFLVYSLAALAYVLPIAVVPVRFGLLTHLLDFVFVVALQVFTDTVSSPFFAYMILMVVSATLRWGRRGAVWTGAMMLAVFLLLGVAAAPLLNDPRFDLNRFIIRAAYLVVVAIMVAYLGLYQEGLKSELAQLAAWPYERAGGGAVELPELLEHAARTLGTAQVALAWEESEEPWVHVACWSPAGFELRREAPGLLERLVPEPLRQRSFLSFESDGGHPTVIWSEDLRARRWTGGPLSSDLGQWFGARDVTCVPVKGEGFQGYLVALDKPNMSVDDLVLAEILGRQLAAGLERTHFRNALQESAAIEARARLAHDLHDGVLQSLTGIELKLDALTRLADCPEPVRGRLQELRQIVQEQHGELRRFIHAMRSRTAAEEPFDLAREIGTLPDRVGRQWGATVHLSVDRLPSLAPALARQVYLVVREGVFNAARHGGPGEVSVQIRSDGPELRTLITDGGRGFGFKGRYDHEELDRLGLGPTSLRHRVQALGGRLTLESSPAGARLDIALPIRPSDTPCPE